MGTNGNFYLFGDLQVSEDDIYWKLDTEEGVRSEIPWRGAYQWRSISLFLKESLLFKSDSLQLFLELV